MKTIGNVVFLNTVGTLAAPLNEGNAARKPRCLHVLVLVLVPVLVLEKCYYLDDKQTKPSSRARERTRELATR